MNLITEWYRNWFRNERYYDKWARDHGYNYTELFVLYTLYETGGCTPGYLADFLSVSKQAVNGILRRFEKKGISVSAPSPTDRRSCVVALSPAAKTQIQAMLEELAQIEDRAFSRLGADNARKMVELDQLLTEYIFEEMQKDGAE